MTGRLSKSTEGVRISLGAGPSFAPKEKDQYLRVYLNCANISSGKISEQARAMEALAQVPDWFGEAVLAIVAGVVGFFTKSIWEAIRNRRRKDADRLDALRKLHSLLEDSKAVFASQNYMARRLLSRLKQKHPAEAEKGLGFDETFYRLFDNMDQEERELQSLIRSTTINSMRSLNEELRRWQRTHQEFRTPTKKSERWTNFSEDLQQLELHLSLWSDKYKAAILENERRSLVYMADEKKQGVGFPNRIETSVEMILEELS